MTIRDKFRQQETLWIGKFAKGRLVNIVGGIHHHSYTFVQIQENPSCRHKGCHALESGSE